MTPAGALESQTAANGMAKETTMEASGEGSFE